MGALDRSAALAEGVGADLEPYIYDGPRQADELHRWFDLVGSPDYRLVTTGHSGLDERVALFPGCVAAVAGRPSMGKSLLCKSVARRERVRIEAEGRDDQCVVFVTLEESVPMISAAVNGVRIGGQPVSSADVWRGRTNAAEGKREAIKLARSPLVILAHPGVVDGKIMGPLTPERIVGAIERVALTTTGARRPTLIVLDYLQLLRPDDGSTSERSRVEQVMAAAEASKMLASTFNAVVLMAVQASRAVDAQAWPMPRIDHMQWASSIEQACDVVLGVFRPIRHPSWEMKIAGRPPLDVQGGVSYNVTDDLAAVAVLKNRHGAGYGTYVVDAPYDLSRFTAAEPRR